MRILHLLCCMTRKDATTTLGLPPNESHGCCHLADFILWLHGLGRPQARQLHVELIQWVSLCVDYEGFFGTLDDDPLQTPIPSANKQVRNIPVRFKEAVVKAAASGGDYRSSAHVMNIVKKWRYKNMKITPQSGNANSWHEPVMRTYLWALQTAMRDSPSDIYSVSLDATRVSGKDYLFSSIFPPSLGMAGWCPPVVPSCPR